MAGVLRALAVLCAASALVCGAAALLRTRDAGLAVRVLLDLLLAAGLLRLAAAPDGAALAAAALLVLVRCGLVVDGGRRARA